MQIDFCFAAAGDALEEERTCSFWRVNGFDHALVSNLLLLGHRERLAGQKFLGLKRVTLHAQFAAGDEARFQQRLDDAGCARQIAAQITECRLTAIGPQGFQNAGLHGRGLVELVHDLGGRFLGQL